jgi:Malectin domain
VGVFAATTESFTTSVTDGTLNINFSALVSDGGKDRPKISAIEILTATSANQQPLANAGADKVITLPTSTVSLTGSGTDADGTITGYAWTKISGSGTIAFPNSATTNITGLTQGTSVFQLIVTDNQGATSAADLVNVTVNASAPAIVYRINSGGPQITNAIGTFAADNFFSPTPGFITNSSTPIGGTSADAMFQTQRSTTAVNSSFSYAFPVSNGTYSVVLYFAEVNFTAIGSRVFDITMEGVKVKDNYDIFKSAGAANATAEWFTVNVTDGTLNMTFSSLTSDGGVNRPTVSAIEVVQESSSLMAIGRNIINNLLNVNSDTAKAINAYPNPSRDGRFNVTLPWEIQGPVVYTLYSSSGAVVKKGQLSFTKSRAVLGFDFSQEMHTPGLYHLHLTNKGKMTVLKLIRE